MLSILQDHLEHWKLNSFELSKRKLILLQQEKGLFHFPCFFNRQPDLVLIISKYWSVTTWKWKSLISRRHCNIPLRMVVRVLYFSNNHIFHKLSWWAHTLLYAESCLSIWFLIKTINFSLIWFLIKQTFIYLNIDYLTDT
jgi:hypothetical protein